MELGNDKAGRDQLQQGNEQGQQEPRVPSSKEKTILRHLRENPHATLKTLALKTGLSVDSVGNAIDAMRKKGWIDDGFRIVPQILGYSERYRVDITVIPTTLRKGEGGRPDDLDENTKKRIPVRTQQGLARYIVNTLSKDPAFEETILIEEVSVLLGGAADISAIIWAKDNESMLKFVTYGLRMAEGIQATTTFVQHWSYPTKRI